MNTAVFVMRRVTSEDTLLPWAVGPNSFMWSTVSAIIHCCLSDPPPMWGCYASWGSVSFDSESGQGGPQHHPWCPPTPFWRSGPQCCHCTTWPSRLGTAAPGGPPCTPAGLQSPGPGSRVGQRHPTAGISHPAGPWAQQTQGPAYSGTGHHIWVPWLWSGGEKADKEAPASSDIVIQRNTLYVIKTQDANQWLLSRNVRMFEILLPNI